MVAVGRVSIANGSRVEVGGVEGGGGKSVGK